MTRRRGKTGPKISKARRRISEASRVRVNLRKEKKKERKAIGKRNSLALKVLMNPGTFLFALFCFVQHYGAKKARMTVERDRVGERQRR